MRKRGKSEGTIRKRADGRWEGRVLLGTRDGKRERPSFYAKTRDEVQTKIADVLPTLKRDVAERMNELLG